jgi:hypothetical protein
MAASSTIGILPAGDISVGMQTRIMAELQRNCNSFPIRVKRFISPPQGQAD